MFLTLEHLRSAPRAIADRALIASLQAIHPEDYSPEYNAITRLRSLVLGDAEMTPRTLHGCLITRNMSHAVIMREASAIITSSPIHPGQSVNWDKRWHIELTTEAGDISPYTIRALGNPPHDTVDQLAPGLRQSIPQGRMRAALPAGWQGERLVFIPCFGAYSWPSPAKATLINTFG